MGSSMLFVTMLALIVIVAAVTAVEEDVDVQFDAIMKRSLAVGRLNFRPGKRSLATARPGPGKRSLAVGRMNYRPGKRSVMDIVENTSPMCQVAELQTRMKVMDALYEELQTHWDGLNACIAGRADIPVFKNM